MNESSTSVIELKKFGMLQQRQPEQFIMCPRAYCGDLSVAQLRAITAVAEQYGEGLIHLTTRQGVEIPGVLKENLEVARLQLEATGMRMGANGPRVRVVVACPGTSTCRYASIETKQPAQYLDDNYLRQDTPWKCKMAVTGCPNNCARARDNDIGVMGGLEPEWTGDNCINCNLCVRGCPVKAISKQHGRYVSDQSKCIGCSVCTTICPKGTWQAKRRGYTVWIGGTNGKVPRAGTRLAHLVESLDEVYALIDRTLSYYKANGKKPERLGHMLDRLGTEQVCAEILANDA